MLKWIFYDIIIYRVIFVVVNELIEKLKKVIKFKNEWFFLYECNVLFIIKFDMLISFLIYFRVGWCIIEYNLI